MRRNSAGRRGGPNVSGGPLITEHLKDLDLELELLKRKREMIEQQHHLYSSPQYDSQNQYESPSYNQRQYDSNRDFSHMYDGPSYGQHARKRQADPWEHDLTNMFPNKKKPIQSIFGSRLGPKPGPPGPSNVGHAPARYQRPQSSATYSPRPFKSSPTYTTPPGQKFNKKPLLKSPSGLSKVSKPKPATAPNNLASKPVAERVNLVAEATKSSDAVDESLILREDGTPSRQMTGRLELTLGVLMKEIRDRYWSKPDYAILFKNGHIQRVMKQAIRERIKVVMLGKVVGSNADIKRQYREEYPEDTDIDILNIALGAAGMPLAVKPDRTQVKPGDDDLRNKIYELMDARLDAMFTKLKEIYAEELKSKTGEESQQTDVAVDGSEGNVKGGAGGEGQRTGVAMVRRCLPRILRKYHRHIIELMNADALYVLARDSVAAAKQTGVEEAGSQDNETTPVRQQSLNALPYYIKIRAKPMLPKKKIMREFLAGFNTKTIKKHKTIHNLLFVGFSDKSDHDNMLAASGTVIGQSTLEITPSEKAAPRSNQEDNTSLEISPELDFQITDLLTSIRKAEEEDQGNGEESCEKMDISEDYQSKEVTDENGCAIKDEVTNTVQKEADKDGSTEANAVLEKPEASIQDNKIQPAIKTEIVDPAESVQDSVSETTEKETPMEEAEVPQATQEPEKVTEPKVAAAPAKVAATPAKVTATPAKVAATPANVAATPAKVAATQANVAATLANVAATPAKVAATPAKAADTPAKVTATPAKVAATPANVASTPAKVAAPPAKVAATPAKVAATPAKVAATAAKVAATPAKVAATPAKAAGTPAKVTAPPAKVASTSAKVAETATVTTTPANAAATPAKVAATPAQVAATPTKVAATPAKVAATPAKVAPTPAKVAATPGTAPTKVAATPATTPAKVTLTPAKVAATPATAPAKVAATPAKVAATPATAPAKVAATPATTPAKVAPTVAKVAATPAKVAETPAKVAETPAKVAQTVAKAAETPAKVAETPAKVAETASKVPENSDKVAEPSKTDAENPDTESEKSDTVTELKSDAKETGRSTPTRMTRSANVTPSTIRTRRASRLAQSQ